MPQLNYNLSNELTSTSLATFTYDGNGNTLSKALSSGTTQYTWDFENRLSSAVMPGTGGSVTFKYDPFGRRIQKAFAQGTTTTTTNYLYDGASDIEEVDQNGNLLARYTQGVGIDEPLAEFRSSTSSFYEQDGLGSVTSLSGSTGALINTYIYKAFGNLASSEGSTVNPFQYTGRDYDAETGLHYYRARYYDSSLGRFISEDPARLGGGASFYPYADNGPVNFVDPSGLQALPKPVPGPQPVPNPGPQPVPPTPPIAEPDNPTGPIAFCLANPKCVWLSCIWQVPEGSQLTTARWSGNCKTRSDAKLKVDANHVFRLSAHSHIARTQAQHPRRTEAFRLHTGTCTR